MKLQYHDNQPVQLGDTFTAPRWGDCTVQAFDVLNQSATCRNVSTGEVFDLLGQDTFGESDLIARSLASKPPAGFICYASSPTEERIRRYIADFYGGEHKDLHPTDKPGHFSVSTAAGRVLSTVVIRTRTGFYFGSLNPLTP